MNILFPDVSFYQKEINFDTMKSKTDYIILRAGQKSWVDIQFNRNKSECERLSIPYGIYWFYDDRDSPEAQAQLCNSLIHGYKPLEIWCDWENTYNGNYKGIKNVVTFMQELERLSGMEVHMYTGYYWFMENTSTLLNFKQLSYLKGKKLWLAAYTKTNAPIGEEYIKIPRPWTGMDIWQYGTPAIGKEYGVMTEEIDMNKRIGTQPIPPMFDNRKTIVRGGFTYEERK